MLSTPHGTLGTCGDEGEGNCSDAYLSTPHGTLGTPNEFDGLDKFVDPFQLHTVHQELSLG